MLPTSNAFATTYSGPRVVDPIICLPLKAGGSKWDNNELRYCLRAIAQYWHPEAPTRPKIYLLTTAPPKWINPEFVSVVQADGYTSAIRKALTLAESHSPSQHYVWWNDDIFLLRPTSVIDLLTARHILGPMSPLSGITGNDWRKKLCRVRNAVHAYGFSPVYNFSSHTPYLFQAAAMQRVIACIGIQYKTPIETAYFNFMRAWHPRQLCVDKLVFYSDRGWPANLEPYRFLSVSDSGLSTSVKTFLLGRFSNKCCYEL